MKRASNEQLPWPQEVVQFVEQKTSTSIQDLETLKLAGDASSRTFWRLKNGPNKWVLIITDPFPNEGEKTDFINVHSYLNKCNVHVPEIYDFSPELGLFLIEDLGNTLLSKSAKKLTPKQYAKYYFLAIDELFKMHFGEKDENCVAFTREFDTKKYIWELEHTKNFLLNKHLNISLFTRWLSGSSGKKAKMPPSGSL